MTKRRIQSKILMLQVYYTVIASNGQCEGTSSIEVLFFEEQFPANNLDLGPPLIQCAETVISFSPTVPALLQYKWSDGVVGAEREFTEAGQYELIGIMGGCSNYWFN